MKKPRQKKAVRRGLRLRAREARGGQEHPRSQQDKASFTLAADGRHAYLNDPDGHEISLYWAGENRMKKTVMKAGQKAARA